MIDAIRSRLTYANVMATIAVFVALGGSSYAALRIGSTQIVDNSVRSKDLRNNDIRSRDLRNNDIRSVDVRNGALLAEDFAAGQLPAGAPGPAGAQGPAGPPGPTAAGYAVNRPPGPSFLPNDASFGTTITLNSGTNPSGPVTVSFPAALLVTGTTQMQNGDGSIRTLACRLVLNPGPGSQQISPEVWATVPSTYAHTGNVTGSVEVAPGTYDVAMECASQLANGNGTFGDAALSVVAVPR